jgi:hypothetical protein
MRGLLSTTLNLGSEIPLDGNFLCDRRLLVEPFGDKYLALTRLLPISAL